MVGDILNNLILISVDIAEGTLSLLIFPALLVIGIFAHIYYLNRMQNSIEDLTNKHISRSDLYGELVIPQGSNFNSFAAGAWLLFFVALAFLYFLTPTNFAGFNYFNVPTLASSPIGFLIFGLLIFLLTGPISANLPRIYSFYEIHIRIKAAIMLTFPLLMISLACSIYLGTIYPLNIPATGLVRLMAFMTLLISQIMLLSPIYIGFVRVVR